MSEKNQSTRPRTESVEFRCIKCLMPSSAPGIQFDSEGLCSFCREDKPIVPKGVDTLLHELSSIDSARLPFDCLVPISGGLDSFYTAYYLKNRLKLRCCGVHYDHGLGSHSKEDMLRWIENNLDMPIIRVRWSREKTIKLVASGMRSLIPFGPKYMQAALCRHCGYGIRAAVYSEMVRLGIHSVWGMHTMDNVPFRYCLEPDLSSYLLQPHVYDAALTMYSRWLQMRDIPAPDQNPFLLITKQFGYPTLPPRFSHLKVLSFFHYIPWNKKIMIDELSKEGVHVEVFQQIHSDCSIAPVVDHVLRAAWTVGKAEIYVCNRVRAGQLSTQEGREMIEKIRQEELPREQWEQLGLLSKEFEEIFSDEK